MPAIRKSPSAPLRVRSPYHRKIKLSQAEIDADVTAWIRLRDPTYPGPNSGWTAPPPVNTPWGTGDGWTSSPTYAATWHSTWGDPAWRDPAWGDSAWGTAEYWSDSGWSTGSTYTPSIPNDSGWGTGWETAEDSSSVGESGIGRDLGLAGDSPLVTSLPACAADGATA